jgi:hypothetical protein
MLAAASPALCFTLAPATTVLLFGLGYNLSGEILVLPSLSSTSSAIEPW